MSTFEEVIAAAKETGFHVDEDGSMWDHNDYVEQDDCGMQGWLNKEVIRALPGVTLDDLKGGA